ncbi:glycosyl hydrolase family 18 protein [Bacillus sp. z60-18]|uniref:glycosyl hydrolase family 18 protein n=1 Tax=Bacillus TaxID=1386 RepID=UPI00098AFD14|nr:glycosyl hydrolase family 18 protein [Bacillus sonorensis]
MKKKLWVCLAFSTVLVFLTYVKADAAERMIVGYTTGDSASYQSLAAYHDYINSIATDTFAFDAKGNLIGEAPENQLSFAEKHQIKTWAVISNYNEAIQDFDGDLASAVMTNETNRKRFTDRLVSLAKGHGYDGINIDFEAVFPEERSGYTKFIQYISDILKREGIQTMVSVPAKSADDPEDDWSWPYDYGKIGAAADFVQVMTYDEHGSWSEPGSVCSMGWIKSSLEFAVEEISSDKVIMGIPSYGYDWDLTDQGNNTLKQWNEIRTLKNETGAKPKYDSGTASMTFSYVDQKRHQHVVWYENENTVEMKSRLTNDDHLAGVSVYSLGYESESFWQAVQKGTE